MQKYKTLPDAIALAEFAHRNQTDKAGFNYIEHPRRVLARVQQMGAPPFAQIAAILHDVTEDTAFTPEILTQLGFSEAVVRLVRLLDRNVSKIRFLELGADKDDIAYYPTDDAFSKFYYGEIAKDEFARKIKRADIADNTEPWRLSYLEPKTQERLRRKYDFALKHLS